MAETITNLNYSLTIPALLARFFCEKLIFHRGSPLNITYIALTADDRRLMIVVATLDEAIDLAAAHRAQTCCQVASVPRAITSTST
jgi:hypothetical protein